MTDSPNLFAAGVLTFKLWIFLFFAEPGSREQISETRADARGKANIIYRQTGTDLLQFQVSANALECMLHKESSKGAIGIDRKGTEDRQ